jgi:hypothetical protein
MKKLIFCLIPAAFSLILFGCNANITPSDGNEGYYLEGAIIKNLDLDRLSISVSLKRNDTILTDAVLRIGDDTLAYNSGKYFMIIDSATHLLAGNHVLWLYDTTFLIDTVSFAIASNCEITSKIPPDTTPYRSGNIAHIEWSVPTNVDGYVYSAAKKDAIYENDGYSAFVTTGVSAVTIDPDAFNLPSGELDTGWYYIYVYGYADSPVPGTDIPTIFPAGLSKSVSKIEFSAKFGSILVSPRDSIHAVAQ